MLRLTLAADVDDDSLFLDESRLVESFFDFVLEFLLPPTPEDEDNCRLIAFDEWLLLLPTVVLFPAPEPLQNKNS